MMHFTCSYLFKFTFETSHQSKFCCDNQSANRLCQSVFHRDARRLFHVKSDCLTASLFVEVWHRLNAAKLINSSVAEETKGSTYVTSVTRILGALHVQCYQQSLSHGEGTKILLWTAWVNIWARSC